MPARHLFERAALEAYCDSVKALATEFEGLWGLICRADDRCRSEHFPRLRRQFQRLQKEGQCPEFDPRRPWGYVFRAAAADDKFWNREVRNPALKIIAQGLLSSEAAERAADRQSGVALASPKRPHVPGAAAAEREIKRIKAQVTADQESAAQLASVAPGPGGRGGGRGEAGVPPNPPSAGGGHPRERGGRCVTAREGANICWKVQRGKCSNKCERGMARACQNAGRSQKGLQRGRKRT